MVRNGQDWRRVCRARHSMSGVSAEQTACGYPPACEGLQNIHSRRSARRYAAVALTPEVRNGSLADIRPCPLHVAPCPLTPESGHARRHWHVCVGPRLELCTAAKIPSSITSTARTSSVGVHRVSGLGPFRSAHNHSVLSDPGTERPMKALESWGLRKAAERMA
jgi:hypothetical protein